MDLKSLVSPSPHTVRYLYIHVLSEISSEIVPDVPVRVLNIEYCAVAVRSVGRVR